MDLDGTGIDEEVEDPPTKWVVLAVAGLVLASVGLVTLVMGLTGLSAAFVGAVPALSVVFDMSIFLLILGAGVFLVSMSEWSPDLDT